MSTLILPSFGRSTRDSHLRKAHSQDSLLAAVGRFAWTPAATLERLTAHLPAPLASRFKDNAENRKAVLYINLRNATTYDEWRAAAVELDELETNNDWKNVLETSDYDYTLVQARLKELEDARISCDPGRMLFLVRTALTRHLGGMGSIRLYKHSHIGTKHLIEKYIETTLEMLATLLDVTRRPGNHAFDSKHLLDQLLQARQSFGRSALLLSGGGTFGMNHIGVVKSLWEAKLLPRIISGASAGSIVASVLSTRTDEEIPAVMEEFCFGDLEVFTRGDEDLLTRQIARFLKHGSLFDISNLERVMSNLLGDMTFQEAYNRTRRILNICVSSASNFELPRLLNYITAPNVVIYSAVMSSCSVPLVFSPAPLLAKDPRTGELHDWNPTTQCWIDGSVDNDLPMTRLAELFNVNHFIVSQVNPHVVPFLDREEEGPLYHADDVEPAQRPGPGWLHSIAEVARTEAMHRMHVLTELGVFPTILSKTMSILNQKYSGDITILPEVSYAQVPKVLQNPTPDFMVRALLAGERATWPKLSRVQNHCAIELALDDAVQQVRARVAFSPSQVNLRLHAMDHPRPRKMEPSPREAQEAEQARPVLRTSKSYAAYAGIGLSPSTSGDPRSSIASNGHQHVPRPTHRPTLSLRSRRSFKHSLKSPPPDAVGPSEEEKMFSTTPMDSSDEDAGYEESLDTTEDDMEDENDYFSLSRTNSRNRTSTHHDRSHPPFFSSSQSQPSTPYARRRLSTSTSGSGSRRPPTPKLNTAATFGLAMTSSNTHANGTANAYIPTNASTPRSAQIQSHTSTSHTPTTPSYEADISGTRGMLLRRKKSLSAIAGGAGGATGATLP